MTTQGSEQSVYQPMATMDSIGWSGANGDVWAQEWRRTDRSFTDLSWHLDRAIADAMGGQAMTVVDVGCGAGSTALAAAAANAQAQLIGIDISAALITVARDRGASASNCRFVAAPVEVAIGEAKPVDMIVSRHGVMFFDDPRAAFSRLRAAMRPGGRLIFSCFRASPLNAWSKELTAAVDEGPPPGHGYRPGPFAFADDAFVHAVLRDSGWSDVEVRPVDFIYRAGGGDDPVADAVAFFSRIGPAARAMKLADPARRAVIMDAVVDLCHARLHDGHVDFPAAAWIWSATNPR